MRHLITASHGPLAGAILKSAAFICGTELISNVNIVEVEMEDSGEKIRACLEAVFETFDPEDEIMALTDVFGGNVTNILTEYTGVRKLHIITGLNLAMVLEALLSDPAMPMEELTNRLCEAGRDGVKNVNNLMEQEDTKHSGMERFGEEEEI